MSLRCSLLGHDYGDAEIEREREEQGSEVVVTVREFEECNRCGDRKIVTENKEVTTLESPAPDLERAESGSSGGQSGSSSDQSGPSGVRSGSAGGRSGSSGGRSRSPGVRSEASSGHSEASTDDAEVMTDESDSGGVETTSPAVEHDFETHSAEDDDGIILDDDGEIEETTPDREPGEWPEADATRSEETGENTYTEWPAVDREDEGYDARPGGGGSTDVSFGGGLTPESAPEVDENETEEVEFVNADGDTLRANETGRNRTDTELSAGFTAGSEAPSLSGPSEDFDVDSEFVCPECGYREGASGSSHRAGDICPECRKGYLAQE